MPTFNNKVENRRQDLVAAVSWMLIIFCALFSISQQAPPDVVSAAASPNLFSATRAMQHVIAIAKHPHPLGSAEHAVVRDYIMKELSNAGLDPQIQQTTGVSPIGRPLKRATVENIVAKLKGTTEGPSVLLMAHYDSVLDSLGASDDGSGVATLLETLRALRTAPPLKNDVVFLFTDGEENGLLGANAFVNEHPWFRDVGLVLNFEARGTGGPSIMFETSEGNEWIIREFARAAPYPMGNSLSYEIYKSLPNDTDLTVFKEAGMPGLNFAYIDGVSRYHSELDDVDALDQRSLQHHGSYALALTQHFGNIDLERTKKSDAIYFDLFGKILIRYPVSWTIPLAFLVSCIFLGLAIVGIKRESLTPQGIAIGALAMLSALVMSALAATLLWRMVKFIPGRISQTGAVQGELYLASFVLLTVALTSSIYVLVGNKASVESLTIGGLLGWPILALGTSLFLPGGSFLFTWPLFFSLPGVGLMIFSKYREPETFPLALWISLNLGALSSILFFVPIVYQIFIALTLNTTYVIIAMFAILLALLIPQLQLLIRRGRWLVPQIAAASAVVLFVVSLWSWS